MAAKAGKQQQFELRTAAVAEATTGGAVSGEQQRTINNISKIAGGHAGAAASRDAGERARDGGCSQERGRAVGTGKRRGSSGGPRRQR